MDDLTSSTLFLIFRKPTGLGKSALSSRLVSGLLNRSGTGRQGASLIHRLGFKMKEIARRGKT